MKKQFFTLLTGAAICATSPVFAMEVYPDNGGWSHPVHGNNHWKGGKGGQGHHVHGNNHWKQSGYQQVDQERQQLENEAQRRQQAEWHRQQQEKEWEAQAGEQKPRNHYYDVLGISPQSTPEEINKAYKQKALQNHPDKNNGDDTLMKEIIAAKEVLTNNAERNLYDQMGHNAYAGFNKTQRNR